MKVRVTLMTENDEHIDERVSDEMVLKIAEQAWNEFALSHNKYFNEMVSVEKVEVVER